MAASEEKEERGDRALRLGFEHGMVVREEGYGDDIDLGLHDSVDSVAGQGLLDLDLEGVMDAVLLWFRAEDGELTDLLAYALDEVGGVEERGLIWLLIPESGREGHVGPDVVRDAARAAGLPAARPADVAEGWDGFRFTLGGR
ncbi:DUF3052 family protein [Kitasatospora sp. NPDC059408]|uniref:DUF3052 family protein n=1 Tax=Kitasatospora sp. NPDC059408 TaxID=3346823 RepID=UPI00367C3E34